VEAGLRSHDLAAPFPEEMNRRVLSMIARWQFAPTEQAAQNLRDERIDPAIIHVTGNTVVDALLEMRDKTRADPPTLPERVVTAIAAGRIIVLVTGHRRESFGQGFANICDAIARLAEAHPRVVFVYPVHLNPAVRDIVHARLGRIANVLLEAPLSYRPFVRLMDASRLLLTDSGGLQEEGPALGKPVLVMRRTTERPEGVEAGINRIVGTDSETIFAAVDHLLRDDAALARMASAKNPYGDGTAGKQIAEILRMGFAN
jgi:UDP-N-acetylglucosamine 2-epimerase